LNGAALGSAVSEEAVECATEIDQPNHFDGFVSQDETTLRIEGTSYRGDIRIFMVKLMGHAKRTNH
jgi:hypothetical protein